MFKEQNNMTSLTYPDGTRTDREYYETGCLKAVKKGDGAYVQYALKLDENGEYKNRVRRVTGNGVETSIVYNRANMRPVAIESYNKKNERIEQSEYTYDVNGNIIKITDKFKTAKTQEFEYDELNRVTKAKGIYGEENYAYNPAGNLLKNKHGEMRYMDSSHPYAVTEDGSGNIYSYDANGNMLTGRGREMKYDAAGRLVSLKKDGSEIQNNRYDHGDHRVVQKRKDGTIIYNISGLYELVKTTSRPDYHTKYIYGMEGDLAAQETTQATLVTATFNNGFLYDRVYDSNPLISITFRGIAAADRYTRIAKNIRHIQYILAAIMLIALFGATATRIVKTGTSMNSKTGIRSINGISTSSITGRMPVWMGAVSLVIMTAMLAQITGCAPGIDSGIDATTTEVTETAGLPGLGLYYFHPDHLGSISYLTDPSGNVVTRMSYTPYGEKVKSACTGLDIFNHKYTGQVDDGEDAGLLYYNARYYDPYIGRFISADSMIPDPFNTQSYNRFSYVYNNPINKNDPTGHFGFMALAIVMVVGAIVGYVGHGSQTGDWSSKNAFKAAGIGAVAAGVGYATGVGVAGLIGGKAGTIIGGGIGGAVGGATGGGLGTMSAKGAIYGGIAGAMGGFVGGSAFASGVPILSAIPVASGLGGATSGAMGSYLCGGDVIEGAGIGFAFGFASGMAIGMLNREFMTEGTIHKGSVMKDGVYALTSKPGDILSYLWSVLVGGFSHVTSVKNGQIIQYGEIVGGIETYEGRGYMFIENLNVNIPATTLGGPYKTHYNYLTNNCSTSLSNGLGINSQWTPYNIYGYYYFPQFGYNWRNEL